MFGREVKLPLTVWSFTSTTEHAKKLEVMLQKAYTTIRDEQIKVKDSDSEEPSIFHNKGDSVWLQSKFFKPGKSHKLQAKYHGYYEIIKATCTTTTYKIPRRKIDHHTQTDTFCLPIDNPLTAPIPNEKNTQTDPVLLFDKNEEAMAK